MSSHIRRTKHPRIIRYAAVWRMATGWSIMGPSGKVIAGNYPSESSVNHAIGQIKRWKGRISVLHRGIS